MASSVRIAFIIVSVSLAQIGRRSAIFFSISNPASSSIGGFPLASAPMGMMYEPMEFLLTHLRLVPEISDALTSRGGPFGTLLKQILAWEAGELTSEHVPPQRIQRMAAIYLEATQWADQVYANASGKPTN